MLHEPDWYNVSLQLFLKNDKGEILALKAAPDTAIAGFYCFPGGRINVDEFTTDYKTLIEREIIEELGSDIKYEFTPRPVSFGRHFYFSPRQNKEIRIFYLCFEAKYLGGKIHISSEHVDYKWFNLNNIKVDAYFQKGPLEVAQRYLALQI